MHEVVNSIAEIKVLLKIKKVEKHSDKSFWQLRYTEIRVSEASNFHTYNFELLVISFKW